LDALLAALYVRIDDMRRLVVGSGDHRSLSDGNCRAGASQAPSALD
jgi:hypothetical protein